MEGTLTVLKVGGSLAREEGLAALCRRIGNLGRRHPLVVVPGGGAFADTVRTYFARYPIAEKTAHRMAVLAMDQYGYMLGDLISNSVRVSDLSTACRVAVAGQVTVLLPSAPLFQSDPLPSTWQVTSDSIAAWVAGQVGARRLVLLKAVDGLFYDPSDRTTPVAMLTVREFLMLRRAGRLHEVDEYLPTILASLDLETWVINGRFPERLNELLKTGRTRGTRIVGERRR